MVFCAVVIDKPNQAKSGSAFGICFFEVVKGIFDDCEAVASNVSL